MFTNTCISKASSFLDGAAQAVIWNSIIVVFLLLWSFGAPIVGCFYESLSSLHSFVIVSDVIFISNSATEVWSAWEADVDTPEELEAVPSLPDLCCRLLVCMPVSLLLMVAGASHGAPWVMLPRFIGALRMYSLQLHKLAAASSDYFKTKRRVDVVVAQYLTYFGIYVSALSSMWYSIGVHAVTDSSHSVSWVTNDSVMEASSVTSSYTRSLYYILVSLFTIGFGDISPGTNVEILFTLFLILNGTIFVALLISSITSHLNNRDVAMNRYRNAIVRVSQYVSKRHGGLVRGQEMLRRYMEHLYGQQNCMLLSELLGPLVLPPQLGGRIKELLLLDQLRNTSYFKNLGNEQVLLACVRRLQLITFVPGHEIVVQGERLNRVILVRSGKLDVFASGVDKALCQLLPGDCYGEYETLYGSGQQTCGMIIKSCAGEHTDVAVLAGEDFALAFKLHHASLPRSDRVCVQASVEAHKRAVEAVRVSHHSFVMKCHKMQSTMAGLKGGGKEKKMAAMMANKVVAVKYSPFIVLPSSGFRLYWDLIVAAGVLFVALAVPITVMQEYSVGALAATTIPWSPSLALCYAVYYLLLVPDVVMRAGMFAYEQVLTGDFEMKETVRVLVAKHPLILRRFLGTRRCWLSLFYCLPFEALGSVFGYMSCWYIPKLLALLLFPQILQDIQAFLDTKQGGRFSISNEMFIVLLLSVSTLVIIVWNSTAWSMLHYDGNSFGASVYFTLTAMTTSGYGDITPATTMQTLYVCGFCVIGPVVSASIIGNIASYVHCVEQSTESLEHRKTVSVCFADYLHKASAMARSQSLSQQGAVGGARSTITTVTSPTASVVGHLPRGRRTSVSVAGLGSRSSFGHTSLDSRRSSAASDFSGGGTRSASSFASVSTDHSPGRRSGIHRPSFDESGQQFPGVHGDGFELDGSVNEPACRLVQYYEYVDRVSAGFDGQMLMGQYVPSHLMEVFHQEDVAAIVSKIVMFADCDKLFLRTVRRFFQHSVYLKGERILVAEPAGGEAKCSGSSCGRAGLYYIDTGIVAVNSDAFEENGCPAPNDLTASTKSSNSATDEEDLLYYGRGETFGGQSLFPASVVDGKGSLGSCSFTGVVTAHTDCALYFLATADFLAALKITSVPDSVLVKMFSQCHANRRVSTNRRASGSFAAVLDNLRAASVGAGGGGPSGVGGAKPRSQSISIAPLRRASKSERFNTVPSTAALPGSKWALVRANVPRLTAYAAPVEAPTVASESLSGDETTAEKLQPRSLVARAVSLFGGADPYGAATGERVDSMENAVVGSKPAVMKAQLIQAASTFVAKTDFEQEEEGMDDCWYDPVGPVFGLWTVVVLLGVIFVAIALPVTMTAAASSDYGDFTGISFWCQPMLIAYHCVDVILLADIYFRGCLMGYYEATELVTDRGKIWLKYKSSGQFLLHLCASLPVELVVMLTLGLTGVKLSGPSSSCVGAAAYSFSGFSGLQVYSFCHFLRLLRLSEVDLYGGIIGELWRSVSEYYELGDAMVALKVHKNVTTLCGLVCVMCYCAHVIGCTFLTIGLQAYYTSSADGNWLTANDLLPLCSNNVADIALDGLACCLDVPLPTDLRATLYIHSFYWAVGTLCTVGYGDLGAVSTREQEFNVVVFIIGTIVFALVIVNLTDIISQLDVTHDNFKNHTEKVRTLLNREASHGCGDDAGGAVSDEFLGRVDQYFNTLWTVSRGVDGQEVKSYLPERVYADLMAVHMDTHLASLFFFKDSPSSFLHDACAQFVCVVYLPKDHIFHSGELAASLYVVVSGEVGLAGEGEGGAEGELYASRGIGPLGESEFFNRGCYHYAAVVPATTSSSLPGAGASMRERGGRTSHSGATVVMELAFTSFWAMVQKHGLRGRYLDLMGANFEESHRRSSSFAVTKIQSALGNNKAAAKQPDGHTKHSDKLGILPDSTVAIWWGVLSLFVVAYVMISVPYAALLPNESVRACSDSGVSFHPMSILAVCDVLLLCYSMCDVVLRAQYFGVKLDGHRILKRSEILKAYIGSGSCTVDAVATVPVFLLVTAGLVLFAGQGQCRSAPAVQAWSTLACWSRLLLLLRTHRLSELVDSLMLHMGHKLKVAVNSRMIRLCKGVGLVWYVGHLFACAFCALGYYELRVGNSVSSGSWIRSNGLEEATVTDVYLRSYFIMMYTLSTVGYGSMTIASDGERLFATAVMLCGSIICDAGVAAIMGSMITCNDQQKIEIRICKESIAKFCSVNDVIPEEVAKCTSYFEYVQDNMRSEAEIEAFSYLSPALRMDYTRTLALPLFMKLGVLSSLPPDAQMGYFYSIIRKMQPVVVAPGSKLEPFDLYILRWGKLQCLNRSQDSMSTCTSTDSNASVSNNSRSAFSGSRLSIFSATRRTDSMDSSHLTHKSSTHRCSTVDHDAIMVAAGTVICDKERCFLRSVEEDGGAETGDSDAFTMSRCAPMASRGRRRSSLGRRASDCFTPLEVFHEAEEDSESNDDEDSSDDNDSDTDQSLEEEDKEEEEEEEEEGGKEVEKSCASAELVAVAASPPCVTVTLTLAVASMQLPCFTELDPAGDRAQSLCFRICSPADQSSAQQTSGPWQSFSSFDTCSTGMVSNHAEIAPDMQELVVGRTLSLTFPVDCTQIRLEFAFVTSPAGGHPNTDQVVSELGEIVVPLGANGQDSTGELVEFSLTAPSGQTDSVKQDWLNLLLRFEETAAPAAAAPQAPLQPSAYLRAAASGVTGKSGRPHSSNTVHSIKQIVGDTIVCVSAESVDVTNISAAHFTQTDISAASGEDEGGEPVEVDTAGDGAGCSSLVSAINRSAKHGAIAGLFGKVTASVMVMVSFKCVICLAVLSFTPILYFRMCVGCARRCQIS